MLVLSRKTGQMIVVPNCDLTFTVLGVRGDYVRVGISAPRDIGVYRQEVWGRINEETGVEGVIPPAEIRMPVIKSR